jgi:hypothetical protein
MGNTCYNVPPGSIGGDSSFVKNKSPSSQKYVYEIDPNHVNPYGNTTNPEDE